MTSVACDANVSFGVFSCNCWNSRYLNLLAEGCHVRVCVSQKLCAIEVRMCNSSGACSVVLQMFGDRCASFVSLCSTFESFVSNVVSEIVKLVN